jgi:exonuclease SbcC
MILKTLHLKNFRKFKDTFIEFPDGVTGIIGLNGAGKSTIFEAIAWVLYGPVAARTGADAIRRDDADIKEPCRVSLEFIFNNDAYHITREMTGKTLTPQAIITINNKIHAQGADTVSRFIQNQLGMDFRSFYTSIFAKQKELNALSTMNPSDRRPLILKMLGIDALDTIVTEIRTDTREKKTTINHLETETHDTNGNKKIIHYQEQIQNDITTTTKELNKIKQETQTNKHQYEQLLKQKETLDTIKTKIDHRTQLQEQIKNLTDSLQERTLQEKTLKQQLNKNQNITQDLTQTEKQQQQLTQQYEEILKQTVQIQTKITQITDEIKQISTKKQNITTLGPDAECPTCTRILGTHHTLLLNRFNEEIQEKNKELILLKKQHTDLTTQKTHLSRQKEALTKKFLYLSQQHLEAERFTIKMHGINQEITREQNILQKISKEFNQLKTITMDTKHYQQLNTKIKNTYSHYQQSLKQQSIIQQKREKLRIKLEAIKGEQNLIQQNIVTNKQRITDQTQLLKTLEKERRRFQQLQLLQELMTGFRTYIISQIRPTLSQYASQLFHQLTDGKYSAVELDENYTLLIYDGGNIHQVNRFSGGEEDLANLCIRLAISEVIAERAGSIFQFIILDEIFGSQDAIRRQNIINTLNRFSTKFRQIFLITHIEDIKDHMEHTLNVYEHETGISSVKLE